MNAMATAKTDVLIRSIEPDDAAAVAAIYNHYIKQTTVTFEEEEISAAEVRRRMQEVLTSTLPWLSAEQEEQMIGYAYAGRWKVRSAYRYAVEVTVYVAAAYAGRGVGSHLYRQLLAALKDRKIHAAIGVIALPNEASIALHEKFGFIKAGHLKEVGFKFNQWIDVGYWQLVL